MNIELKNFKHSAFASQETHCYEATVWVDGKKAFNASNDGHGGADNYTPLHTKKSDPKVAWDDFNAVTKAVQSHITSECKNCQGEQHDCIDCMLEVFIGNLINDTLMTKDLKKTLKKKVLFTEGESIYQIGYKGSKAVDQNLIDRVRKDHPEAIVLNTLAFDEAFEFYKDAA